MARMIYKFSGRYRDLESARKNIERELRGLREKGLASQVHQEFFGSTRKEWVLTDKGIRFILEGNQKGASSIALAGRDLVNPSQDPPIKFQPKEAQGSEG
jgi:hypothetical protein